jgi:predicted P-loop ATPase
VKGVDLLAQGSQVVCTPSTHAATFKKYKWEDQSLHDAESIPFIEDMGDLWEMIKKACEKDDSVVYEGTRARESSITSFERTSLMESLTKLDPEKGRHNVIGGWIHNAVGANMGDEEIFELADQWLSEHGRGENEQPFEVHNWIRSAHQKLAAGTLGVSKDVEMGALLIKSAEQIDEERLLKIAEDLGPILPERTLPEIDAYDESLAKDYSAVAWRAGLLEDSNGNVMRNSIVNIIRTFQNHPEFSKTVFWDAFSLRCICTAPLPWHSLDLKTDFPPQGVEWTMADNVSMVDFLQTRHGIVVKPDLVATATVALANSKAIHPPRRYIRRLKWDGVPRIKDFFTKYCNSTNMPISYLIEVAIEMWVSIVARIHKPGCQVDTTVVLESAQGQYKSQMVRAIAGLWGKEGLDDLSFIKDALISLQGKILVEIAEGDGISRTQSSKLKAFMTTTHDHFRMPYDTRSRDYPRQGIFIMTTNKSHYLRDSTGNRRFLPVPVTGKINVKKIIEDRDQLFAEAYELYRRGAKWYTECPKMSVMMEEIQRSRYMKEPLADEFNNFIGNDTSPVLLSEVYKFVLKKIPSEVSSKEDSAITRIARHEGWEKAEIIHPETGRLCAGLAKIGTASQSRLDHRFKLAGLDEDDYKCVSTESQNPVARQLVSGSPQQDRVIDVNEINDL